jgi:hypothetical protein
MSSPGISLEFQALGILAYLTTSMLNEPVEPNMTQRELSLFIATSASSPQKQKNPNKQTSSAVLNSNSLVDPSASTLVSLYLLYTQLSSY